MTTAEQELGKVVDGLSGDERRIILRFAEWLRDQDKEFTGEEAAILRRGERQVRNGDLIWWRDVKRTKVQTSDHSRKRLEGTGTGSATS